jgi:nitric oxide synthase-interacting protein
MYSFIQTEYSVTQKKDIKRQKERLEQLKKETEEEKERAREAARERVLRDFEKGQLGLSANLPSVASASSVGAKDCTCIVHLLGLVCSIVPSPVIEAEA